MPIVKKRATAKRDLIDHFIYLAENADIDVADRFLANAEISFNILSQQPSMGAPLSLKHPDLAGTRKWRVVDFDNFLIFYIPRHDGVSIVRVLHSAQDWRALLALKS